jgi:thiol-disulfide isomerase/thioredoxin
MNNFCKHLLIFSYAILALACSHSAAPTGKATLSGKIIGSFPAGQTSVIVSFPIPVFNKSVEYETTLKEDGSFSISAPVFFPTYSMLVFGSKEYAGLILLSPDKETKIELSFNEAEEIQVNIIEGSGLTPEKMDELNVAFMNCFSSYMKVFSTAQDEIQTGILPDDYEEYILQKRDTVLSNIEGIENLSEDLKPLVSQLLPTGWSGYLFEADTLFTSVKPDRSYYSFLRLLDLNNPPFQPHIGYPATFKRILADKILNIPCINDQPIDTWSKEVKSIMADLIGSDTGLFYDMLAFHAFLNQLEEGTPLSDKQKENIQVFFKNPTFTEYLFTSNEEIIKTESHAQASLHETPKVAKEKLMEAIVSTYKGNVVLVDFWATWCHPCMMAMREIEPMKQDMKDKHVVFIYITGPSSPIADFEKRKEKIAGEHYYLTQEEWDYIFKDIDSNSIPTYLIYDVDGTLKNKSIGFPGVEEMQKRIEDLLP